MCRSAGADVLINYSEGDFKKLLKKHGVYGSVDVVYDPVGGKLSEPCMRALAWGGRFIVIGFASGGSNPKSGIPKIPLNLALLNERKILVRIKSLSQPFDEFSSVCVSCIPVSNNI